MTVQTETRRRGRVAAKMAGWALAVAIGVLAPAAAWAQPVQIGGGLVTRTSREAGTSAGTKPPPLVNADDELAGFLDKARELVDEKAYDRAIDILQALIDRPDSGFVPPEDGRHFVPMVQKANELLGQMGEEGLKRYRRRFNPMAKRIYDKALAEFDQAALRSVAHRYRWTDFGPQALEALATGFFDQGRFQQAQWVWREARRMRKGTADEPLLMAKVAVACHLAGETEAARKALAELRDEYPKARARVGGREQDVVAFTEAALGLTAPIRPQTARQLKGWPGLGGIADGQAVMGEAKVVLVPRWRVPAQTEPKPGENLAPKLLIGKGLVRRFQPSYALTAELRGGLVKVTSRQNMGSRSTNRGSRWMPPLLSPVVVGDMVICREDEFIKAYDLLTGQFLWRSAPQLPLERDLKSGSTRQVYYGSSGLQIGEWSHQRLTVGGGRVYAVANYTPQMRQVRTFGGVNNTQHSQGDTSQLVALSLTRQGSIDWKTGGGQGGEGPVANGKFLTAPTYHAGRLYAVISYIESFYLSCLSANTGEEIWSVMIAQVPAINRRYGYTNTGMFTRASPVAVADGTVFALTNCGAIAAFEADTGRPVWAYQYDSQVNRPGGYRAGGYSGLQTTMPPNPLIVTNGRLICMPIDSSRILALSVDDGQEIWAQERGTHQYLSAIDADRILLAGRGLAVRSTVSGEELFGSTSPEIVGRPAVTPTTAMASSENKLVRLSLTGKGADVYQLTTVPLEKDGLLGNLVSVDGKLIAANAAGLCAYFEYRFAREELTRRIQSARDDPTRWQYTFQRGQVAFNAEEFPAALADFEACRKQPGADRADLLSLGPWFFRTYVALGNRAPKPADMLARFRQAEQHAVNERQKVQMKIRIAKYHERVGQYARAVELAQKMAEDSPEVAVADVPIGPKADDTMRLGPDSEFPAREWAFGKGTRQGFIGRILAQHGRGAYAALDARAKAEFDKNLAAKAPEGLIALARRWPHSQWADDARFRAAEIYYNAAAGERSPQKIDEILLEKVVPQLSRVYEMKLSPFRVSAKVAMVAISAQYELRTVAKLDAEEIRDLPANTPVAFADLRGTLGPLLKEILGGNLPRATAPTVKLVSRIPANLTDIFKVKGNDVMILRDQDYNPIRVGDRVLVLRGTRAVLLNTLASKLPERDTWACLADVKLQTLQNYLYSPGRGLVCGLSRDGRTLLIADRAAIRGVSMETSKLAWSQQAMTDIGIGSLMYMGTGSGALVATDSTGKVVCVDNGTGEIKWKANLPGGRSNLPGRSTIYARPTGPPKIAAGCVFVRYDNFRSLACYDLKSGKIVRKWTGTSYLEAYPTEEGLLALMIDGTVSVKEIVPNDTGTKTFKDLWEHNFGTSSNASILGVSRSRLAVAPSQSSNEVQILSLARNRTLATFKAKSISGNAAVPVEAYFDGASVYVACTTGRFGRPRSIYGRLSSIRGLSLEKFHVDRHELLWSKGIISGQQQTQSYLMPLVIGQDHVVVSTKQYSSTMRNQVHVISAEKGTVTRQIDLGGVGGNTRLRMIGPPVMTNGRICVEDSDGLTVYGGQ